MKDKLRVKFEMNELISTVYLQYCLVRQKLASRSIKLFLIVVVDRFLNS